MPCDNSDSSSSRSARQTCCQALLFDTPYSEPTLRYHAHAVQQNQKSTALQYPAAFSLLLYLHNHCARPPPPRKHTSTAPLHQQPAGVHKQHPLAPPGLWLLPHAPQQAVQGLAAVHGVQQDAAGLAHSQHCGQLWGLADGVACTLGLYGCEGVLGACGCKNGV
jgi:hypothetical protein